MRSTLKYRKFFEIYKLNFKCVFVLRDSTKLSSEKVGRGLACCCFFLKRFDTLLHVCLDTIMLQVNNCMLEIHKIAIQITKYL